MANLKQATRKIGKFLKKNGYIFLIVICIAAIGTIIGVTVYQNNQNADPDTNLNPPVDIPVIDDKPGGDTNLPDVDIPIPVVLPISFIEPVNGTISTEYSATTLCWNQTLGQYSMHLAVDYTSTTDQNVYAVSDGVVGEVDTTNPFLGNYVTIVHEEGYVSKYYSLGADIEVIAGQTVKKGDVLGVMSNSMGKELSGGVHLHFEMTKDNKGIDPTSVLVLKEK